MLETIRAVDCFEAAYHLVDEEIGDSISVSFFEGDDAANAAEAAVRDERQRLGKSASPADEVHRWRVVAEVHR